MLQREAVSLVGGEWVTLGSLPSQTSKLTTVTLKLGENFLGKRIAKNYGFVMWVRLRGFDVSQWEDSFPDTWETCVKSRKMPGMVQNLVNSGINYQYLSMLNWCMSFSHQE